MSTEKRPKVSVLMITYNHEKYIEQAVRSVMIQETDFDYELVIGEDCSTDGTRDILLRLKQEFGNKIRLILQPNNVGMSRNFVDVYGACTGTYFALIEGDDYWTSRDKLRLQIEYMTAHPECCLSYHSADRFDELNAEFLNPTNQADSEVFDPARLFGPLHIMTATVVFRNPQKPLPEWMLSLKHAVDWVLYYWIWSQGGSIQYISSTPMAVYRIHENGISFQPDLIATRNRKVLQIQDRDIIIRYVDNMKHKRRSFASLADLHNIVATTYSHEGKTQSARYHARKCVSCSLRACDTNCLATSFKILLSIYFPSSYRSLKKSLSALSSFHVGVRS